MHHTIKEIIENQKFFKEDIHKYLLNSVKDAKELLNKIESEDDFIASEKKKLTQKFKKTKHKLIIDKLFFMHSKRNEKYYAWWNYDNGEVNILKYDR